MDENITKEYYAIIKTKISQGSVKAGLEQKDKLLYNFPSDPVGYYFKGVCFFALESYDVSVKYYINALKLDPAFVKAYYNLGVSYYMLEKKDLALINIAKALVLSTRFKKQEERVRCVNTLRFIGARDDAI